jgi:hypothetical protein
MTMKRTSIAFLGFVLISSAAAAQQRIALREGIVIDPNQPVAYIMTPQRGIAAIDLLTGATKWSTNAAAKPLALSGNRLLSQADPQAATNRLELVSLNVQKGGAASVKNAASLPEGVLVSVGQTLAGQFTTAARTEAGGDVTVTWSWLPRVPGGMNPDAERGERSVMARETRRVTPVTGAIRINPTSGATSRVASLAMIPAASSSWILQERIQINDAQGNQYESADGRNVLASERVADDREWQKYRWSVFERSTGRKIGEMRSHLSFAPFVVRDNTVIFETTPFIAPGSAAEPAKLRGVSLETGRETWSVPVREVVYRGPMPP